MDRKDKSKYLRKELTPPEVLFWDEVRDSKIGYKFRRQYPIDNYILDFYCYEKNLNIEIDGKDHELYKEDDDKRDEYMKYKGIKVIRYKAVDIFNNLDNILMSLKEYLDNL